MRDAKTGRPNCEKPLNSRHIDIHWVCVCVVDPQNKRIEHFKRSTLPICSKSIHEIQRNVEMGSRKGCGQSEPFVGIHNKQEAYMTNDLLPILFQSIRDSPMPALGPN